jgi:hypothetical protein
MAVKISFVNNKLTLSDQLNLTKVEAMQSYQVIYNFYHYYDLVC